MSLQDQLTRHSIMLPDPFYKAIERYSEHLFTWNKVHNLTGIKSTHELEDFIIDALYPLSFLPAVKSAMDIGTGAGFPGMILAMALPNTHFTLVEPLKKRAAFLQFIKADLGLENVTVIAKRVEEITPQPIELITSRAVTDTNMLLALSKPFRNAETLLLFYKGENVFNEVDTDLPHRIIQTDHRHYLLIGEA